MLYYSVTPKEINAWWDSRTDMKKGYKYCLKLNGELVGTTKRIFFDFENLSPNTVYQIEFMLIDRKGQVVGDVECVSVKTAPAPQQTDISKPPYLVVGDGVTDYTDVINKVISKTDGILYFPKGKYVCKNLCINANCNLMFEKGAVLLQKERCYND